MVTMNEPARIRLAERDDARDRTDGPIGSTQTNDTWLRLFDLATAVVQKGDAAWPPFWVELQPILERLVRQEALFRTLDRSPADSRDIIPIAWEKLQQRDYRKIRAFFDRQLKTRSVESLEKSRSALEFRAWMRHVVRNIGIDYIRSIPEYIRDREPKTDGPSAREDRWRAITTLHSSAASARDPVTVDTTAKMMLEFLDHSMPNRQRVALHGVEKGKAPTEIAEEIGLNNAADLEPFLARARHRAAFRPALELWTYGFDAAEIAARLGLCDAKHANRILNSAKQLLRRHFRPS